MGRTKAKISSIFPQVSGYLVSSVRKNMWKQCVLPNRFTFSFPLPGQKVKSSSITCLSVPLQPLHSDASNVCLI